MTFFKVWAWYTAFGAVFMSLNAELIRKAVDMFLEDCPEAAEAEVFLLGASYLLGAAVWWILALPDEVKIRILAYWDYKLRRLKKKWLKKQGR